MRDLGTLPPCSLGDRGMMPPETPTLALDPRLRRVGFGAAGHRLAGRGIWDRPCGRPAKPRLHSSPRRRSGVTARTGAESRLVVPSRRWYVGQWYHLFQLLAVDRPRVGSGRRARQFLIFSYGFWPPPKQSCWSAGSPASRPAKRGAFKETNGGRPIRCKPPYGGNGSVRAGYVGQRRRDLRDWTRPQGCLGLWVPQAGGNFSATRPIFGSHSLT